VKLKWLVLAISLLVGAATAYLLWLDWLGSRYDPVIRVAAAKYGVDPALVKAIAWKESHFDPHVRGKAGELGLMQIRADAAAEWASAEQIPDFSHEHCADPGTNVLAASWYLRKALGKYAKGEDDPVPYALAEYNAGRKHVLRWRGGAAKTNSSVFLAQISYPSTSNYVRQILSRRLAYEKDFEKR
jgi:soluble lytic murein transglycosylase